MFCPCYLFSGGYGGTVDALLHPIVGKVHAAVGQVVADKLDAHVVGESKHFAIYVLARGCQQTAFPLVRGRLARGCRQAAFPQAGRLRTFARGCRMAAFPLVRGRLARG